jgi:glycosyltransferase involved in cell wall biosynthesis
VDRAEAVSAYVDADVFVLPSYTENFGMTVAEAMASGCAVVISDQVNIRKEVADGGAGVVVNLDVQRLAEALTEVLGDPVGAASMGAAGRALVKRTFTWDTVSEQMEEVYERLARRGDSARVASGR